MRPHLRRIAILAAVGLVGAGLAGCSFDAFTYTVNRYGTVKEVHVHLGCHDTYEVFDRRADGTLIVVTGPINEAVVTSCGEGAALLSRPERMRRAAAIFLAETTERPDCRLDGETELTPYHTEFAYRCPTPTAPQMAMPRRRRG